MHVAWIVFLRRQQPPGATRTDTLRPYATLFRSAGRAAAARIDAVEAFGKPGQMLGRDAVAPIDDRQRDVAGIAGLESHRDRGAGAPVFHRIADEVVDRKSTRLNSSH